mgnify:CR=1 FL=1
MKQVSEMINFSGISNKSNFYSFSTGAKPQEKTETPVKQQIISYGNYELSNNVAAMKTQVAQDNIKFNKNFLSTIQYLNAQAAVGMHKNADSKVFVSAEAFRKEPTEFLKSASLSEKLEYIDNMTEDVTNGLASIAEQYNTKLNTLYA